MIYIISEISIHSTFSTLSTFSQKCRILMNRPNILYIDICPKHCANQWNSSITNQWLRGLKFQEQEDPKMPYKSSINSQTGWSPSNRVISNAEEILKEFRKGVEVKNKFGPLEESESVNRRPPELVDSDSDGEEIMVKREGVKEKV